MGMIWSPPPFSAQVQAWHTMLVGGGGYMTGIDIANDNTVLAHSDTFPAVYLFNNSLNKFIPIVTSQSMPSGFISPRSDKETGAWEARICPNNSSKMYMLYSNALFVSTNSGGTWTQLTNFPTITDAGANDGFRPTGWRMAVDPQNDAICYVGTPSAGLQVTSNSGASWSTAPTVSASTGGGGIAIAFDPTSSVSGGKKQGIFAFSQGVGCYRSTNGGTGFTLMNTSGMPTTFNRMIVDQNGVLHVVNNDTFGWYSWTSGGGWVNHTVIQNSFGSIAIDPNNANKIHLIGTLGRSYISTDGGVTFPSNSPQIITSVTTTGDAGWQALTNFNPGGGYSFSCSSTLFDSNSTLYLSWGFGVWKSTNPFSDGTLKSITYQAMSRGIEGLDCNYIIHPPGGVPIGVAWDIPIWIFSNPNSYISSYAPSQDFGNQGPNPVGGVAPTWNIEYASSTPTFLCALINPSLGGAFSSDSGSNWAAFASQTPFSGIFSGGCMAASTTSNIVAMCAGTSVSFTTNGGTSWTASTYVGNGYPTFPFQNSITVAADRVTANKFYIYSTNDGFYSSTNSGATFTKVSSFNVFLHEGLIRLKAVPGKAGHVFFTGGFNDTGTPPDVNDQLYWNIISAAGSLTGNTATGWSTVSGFAEVTDFGFGTVVAGQTYPTLYVSGFRSGVYAIWMCQNFNSSTGAGTWTALGTNANGDHYPEGWFSLITGVAGDPSVDGACSVSFNNGGFKRFGI